GASGRHATARSGWSREADFRSSAQDTRGASGAKGSASGSALHQAQLGTRRGWPADVFACGTEAVLQSPIMNPLHGLVEGEPGVLGMLFRVQTDFIARGQRCKDTDNLDFLEATVVDGVRMLGGPDGLRDDSVDGQLAIDGRHDTLAFGKNPTGNLPEAAAIEIPVGLQLGAMQQQVLHLVREFPEDPDIENIGIEMHAEAVSFGVVRDRPQNQAQPPPRKSKNLAAPEMLEL